MKKIRGKDVKGGGYDINIYYIKKWNASVSFRLFCGEIA
jgi:hypothetical protein